MLFEVLSTNVDVFHQTLASVSPPLLNRILSAQREYCHVLQRQAEAAQASVELLGETLSHLVALILKRKRNKGRIHKGGDERKLFINQIIKRVILCQY